MRASLVLDPTWSFARVSERLAQAGWRAVSTGANPIVPGEPEHAVFERAPDARAFYTFNPVCQLRVLEFPAEAESEIGNHLPAVDRSQIESWLSSTDERTVLRGVLATRQMPDEKLGEQIEALRQHPRAAIAKAAAKVADEIRAGGADRAREDAARASSLAAIELLKTQVRPVLEAMGRDPTGEAVRAVRPREHDCARVFVGDAVALARQSYEAIWTTGPEVSRPSARQVELRTFVSPAGMLASDNELSRQFPGGYRAIAKWLNPHRVWVAWKFVAPGQPAGMAYNGLVWCDDHWAWFPKPYRALAPLLGR